MKASKVRDGLWRWTVPHPAWKPEFLRVIGVALRRRDEQPTVAVLPNFWLVAGIEWR
jgi:hypothetical protein